MGAFAAALLLLISLATYNPSDPAPFFKTGASGPARNFIGPAGAFIAELLIPQLFGLAAMLLPVVLALWGWRLFWCRRIEAPYTKAAGLGLLLLSVTGFLTLSLGTVNFEGDTVRAGGAAGVLVSDWLIERFNRAGAYIIVLTCLIVAVILATQFSFAAFLRGMLAIVQARLRSLTTAWAHYRENKRKERLRRDVIRKHTQQRLREEMANGSLKGLQAAALEGDLRTDAHSGESPEPRIKTQPTPRLAERSFTPPPKPRPDADFEASDDIALPDVPKAPRSRRARAEVKVEVAGDGPLPPPSLLDAIVSEGRMDKAGLFEKARALEAKTSEFDVNGSVVAIHPGPVVTTYEYKPDAGVKYSRIVGLADDLALALEAEALRIDRMSGRGTVGIEIPNEGREMISLREIIESEAFQRAPGKLTLALGKTVSGETYVADLSSMPHLLIAGATGTGKSTGLNCMIASILFKCTPDECRLILIDPKRLELGLYEDIPHLLTPVVTDTKIAANVLKWAVAEMEKRIRKLAAEGVRNIDQFNNIVRAEKGSGDDDEELKPLHYIVIVIDELADLMMVSQWDVEESITRLAQMARAVGIHLILATQRPSVDVITGLIKANFPSRISFRVAARVDSRTILDSIGAEHLLGRGDMLFLPPGSARLLRIHGAFVSEVEIGRLTAFLRRVGKPAYDETVGKTEKTTEAAQVEDRDELFDEAVRFVVQSGQASTSMLQRRFRIGFSRAGRLIDMMERDGIIGPADGSKPREILVTPDYYETVDAWPK